MLETLYRAAIACAMSLSLSAVSLAQDGNPSDGGRLTGTLKKIRDGGVVRLGHRENSPPFAFIDARGQVLGYSIDLCQAIVEQLAAELGVPDLKVEYRPVTPENRFAMLLSGEIDLECGSTTNNLERRAQVAFSPVIFVTGTKLLVRKQSTVRSLQDLDGKTVVVTRGTTNAAAVVALANKRKLAVNIITGNDHAESMALLEAGRADAFANDDVLLYGLIGDARKAASYRVTGDFLSYDPYGLMYRRDDAALARVVERTFGQLAVSGELVWIYDKWFLRRLPSGMRLNLPMSPQLEESFRVLGLSSS